MPKSRVTIVGLGLIGGSMGLALKKAKLDLEIVGHDKDPNAAGRALKGGMVDKTDWNLINACDGAGLIVLALPLGAIRDTLAALTPHLVPGAIITDTATTKRAVMTWAEDLPQGVHFVGGDPVLNPNRLKPASGADANLFRGATYCLTPSPTAAEAAIETLSNFVTVLGARSYFVDAVEHDGLLAGVQHLPALLATALTAAVIRSPSWRELGKLASADFRAATALAPSDSQSAREQFLAHRADLVRWIDALSLELLDLRGLCEREDAAALEALLQSVATERHRWLSGSLATEESVDWAAVRFDPTRLLVGGLADRGKKSR